MGRPDRVTLDDVACAAGVSRATASRAITGSGPSSPQVRARVLAAVDELGFTPNPAARALASSKAQAVALVIPEPNSLVLADPFLTGMITGMSEAFHASDYQLILVIVRPDDEPAKALRLLRPCHVDGAVIVSHHRSGQLEQAIGDPLVPTVYVGRPWSLGHPDVMYVDVDNYLGAELATRRMLERGATHIGCVAGPCDMTPVQDRTEGWRTALHSAGVEPGPIAHAPFTLAGGTDAMRRILCDNPIGLDGVFVQSDLMAVGAIQALSEAGLTAGEDVLLVGVDDSEFARSTSPKLTTVTNPAAELSLRACRMLLKVIDSGADPGDLPPEIITPTLIIRESC